MDKKEKIYFLEKNNAPARATRIMATGVPHCASPQFTAALLTHESAAL
jgi:hypothetical protein